MGQHLTNLAPKAIAEEQASRFHTLDALEPWEVSFCKWLASRHATQIRHQCEVATQLAGTAITVAQLKAIKRKPGWWEAWPLFRREFETDLKVARAIHEETALSAAILNRKLLKKLHQKVKDEANVMEVVRAAPALTTPYLDRSWPKKEETEHAPQVVIQLTPQQSLSLSSPILEVEATEVEIVEEGPGE